MLGCGGAGAEGHWKGLLGHDGLVCHTDSDPGHGHPKATTLHTTGGLQLFWPCSLQATTSRKATRVPFSWHAPSLWHQTALSPLFFVSSQSTEGTLAGRARGGVLF